MRNTRKQNLKKILEEYSVQELKLYEKYEEMPPHTFSDEYRKNMEKLLEQPMPRRKPAFAYRLAMVCVCIIVALLIVNQASAYVFGMTLWDKLTEPAEKEMTTTVYQEKESGRDRKGDGKTKGRERVHDIPTEIPEGYELVSEKNTENDICGIWEFDDNGQLNFSSYEINQDVHMYDNGEWDIEETVTVAGYQGKLYVKLANSYLYWDDEKYHNSIIVTSVNIPKDELLKIAESLYKE